MATELQRSGGVTPRAALPEGTITFLFTDIEGSTRLWEVAPEGMRVALERHDALVRREAERHGGYVFKAIGDAFCIAFDTAGQAAAAAVAMQRALVEQEWSELLGEDRRLRVRVALHTGDAQERDGDYFGPSLNRAARLLAAGHGGQILLSFPTEELVRDALPRDAWLRDLGDRRLRDLIRPERIFQLCTPGLPETFPPLRTLDDRRHNLPVQPTPLVGRERELQEVRRRLTRPDTRLLTLTGPGGTGKTRLSLQAAAELLDEFEHGVFFVPLAAVTEPALVAPAIAQALDLRPEDGGDVKAALAAFLRTRQLLLVLDNFEQLLGTPEAATLVGELLAATPRLKALSSSRAPLRVYGEREYAVPPLSLPDAARLPPLERLAEYEAVRLFVERASDVRPGFAMTRENAAAIVDVCRRLDGLPLAIELAAARVKVLSPQQLLARLDTPLRLLTAGSRNLPPRQQTLRNLIAWSYELLHDQERRLFRRLGAFAGGWTLEMAEQVCGDAVDDVLGGLESLVEKSLVRRVEQQRAGGATNGGDPRFTFLETIHAFAVEALDGSEDTGPARGAHAAAFLALAEEGAEGLYGHEQLQWLARLDVEHGNIRAALEWLQARREWDAALRLARSMVGYWRARGYLREGRERLDRLLSLVGVVEPSEPLAYALSAAGQLAAQQGDDAAGRRLLERSLATWRALGNRRRSAGVLLNLGTVAYRLGDYASAREVLEEALAVQRELGITSGSNLTLNNLALVLREQGDLAGARAALEESLALKRAAGFVTGMPYAWVNLGGLAVDAGDLDAAARHLADALRAGREAGDPRVQVSALEEAARLLSARDEAALAVRLAAAAAAERERIGASPAAADRRRLAAALEAARLALPRAELERAQSEGLTWSLPHAVEAALATLRGARV